jgi:uncharacterized protein YegP (UPF0339 family)
MTTTIGPNDPISWPTAEGRVVEVYLGQSTTGQRRWYWRVKSTRGQILTTGGQGYWRRKSAKRAAKRLFPEVS